MLQDATSQQKKSVDISIQDLSKIEGHASLDVKVRNGEVKEVHIKFTDNKRFFTQAIQGRSIDTLSQNVARMYADLIHLYLSLR